MARTADTSDRRDGSESTPRLESEIALARRRARRPSARPATQRRAVPSPSRWLGALLLLLLGLALLTASAGCTGTSTGEAATELAEESPAESPAAAVDGEAGWQALEPMPDPRFEAATALLGDALYLFGGYAQGVRASARIDVFDPAENRWRRLGDMPVSLSHMNAVVVPGPDAGAPGAAGESQGVTVWLAGGFQDGFPGKAVRSVWIYDPATDSFTSGPDLPEPRAGGGLALVGRQLHYVGGLEADRDTDAADHWVLDLEGEADTQSAWRPAAPLPAPRNQFATVTFDGRIWVIGGQFHHDSTSGEARDQPRVDVYDPVGDTWRPGPDLPRPHSHAEGSAFVDGDRIVVIGGRSVRDDLAVIWALAPDAETWSPLGGLPEPLLGPVARVVGGELVVVGGAQSLSPVARVWKGPWPLA